MNKKKKTDTRSGVYYILLYACYAAVGEIKKCGEKYTGS